MVSNYAGAASKADMDKQSLDAIKHFVHRCCVRKTRTNQAELQNAA